MDFDDMNIYDIASVLQNLIYHDDITFCISINGEPFNIHGLNVAKGLIELETTSKRITIKDEDE